MSDTNKNPNTNKNTKPPSKELCIGDECFKISPDENGVNIDIDLSKCNDEQKQFAEELLKKVAHGKPTNYRVKE